MSKTVRFPWIALLAWLIGLNLCAQSLPAVHHPFLWDREFSQSPNWYKPETAVLDSQNRLWVLCEAGIRNEGPTKQRKTRVIFVIDDQGEVLSKVELNLPLSQEKRLETSDYRLASLPSGIVGLMFNKVRFDRWESYLGAYYATLRENGTVAPLHQVAGPGPEYRDFLGQPLGGFLLSGSDATLIEFDPNGALTWKKSFRQPGLTNPDTASLSSGKICVSAWSLSRKGPLNKLRVMQLDPGGGVLRTTDISALRGQVAGGPGDSCAVLYDRAPAINRGDYYLTMLDRSFTRQWTIGIPKFSESILASGAEFDLVALTKGYLAQIGNALIEYNWSGNEVWRDIETRGGVQTIAVPVKDGFFIITNGLNMNGGFHVTLATTSN